MTDLSQTKRTWFHALDRFFAEPDAPMPMAASAGFKCSDPWPEGMTLTGLRDALRTALPDLRRVPGIFVAGHSKPDPRTPQHREGRVLLATMGHYRGTFARDLHGIRATGAPVDLRFCDVHEVEDGQIVASWCLIDLLDLARQAGLWPIAPPLGSDAPWPIPVGGVDLRECDAARGDAGFETVLAMHNALLSFDGKSLDSMDHAAHWTEDFDWCGGAGIGTTRGLTGFRAHHQIPFLTGFPDRAGAGHYIRIGDGDFVVTGGWPSVVGTHRGEWLGMPATGKRIEMRVMDFYRLEGGRIAQNWVPIDIPHMLAQMGVDVWARIRHLAGDPKVEL